MILGEGPLQAFNFLLISFEIRSGESISKLHKIISY